MLESDIPTKEYTPSSLPPPEVRLWDAHSQGRLPTPIDSHGLVDLDALIALGKDTVADEFDWESSFTDIHHLQWPGMNYRGNKTHYDLRELRSRKTLIPRKFHCWLHWLTEPPPLPSLEIAEEYVRAEEIALRLASTAELAIKLTRTRAMPEKRLQSRLDEVMGSYAVSMERARSIPSEFQRLPMSELEVDTVDDMLQVGRKLGKRALRCIPLRTRSIYGT